MTKVDVLGVGFDNYTQTEFMALFAQRLAQQQGTFVVTANPEIVMAARDDAEFQGYLAQADFITADGIGVVKGAQILGTPLKERVTGFDLFMALLTLANQQHYRVYLIGAQADVIQQAQKRLRADFPNIELVGCRNGYFTDTAAVQADIIAAAPQMVFAGLGAKKQERFLVQLKQSLPAAYLMGIGGSFDVFSGKSKRAPKWMQNLHLEWFYRLLKEPSRWRRMLVLPKFLRVVKRVAREQR